MDEDVCSRISYMQRVHMYRYWRWSKGYASYFLPPQKDSFAALLVGLLALIQWRIPLRSRLIFVRFYAVLGDPSYNFIPSSLSFSWTEPVDRLTSSGYPPWLFLVPPSRAIPQHVIHFREWTEMMIGMMMESEGSLLQHKSNFFFLLKGQFVWHLNEGEE